MNRILWVMAGVWLLACPLARASDEVDPSKLYDLSTAGSTQKLKLGDKGTVVIAITAKPGAHVSDEAPIKIELSGANLKLAKQKLTAADSLAKKDPAKEGVSPRFEVPFTGAAAGKGTLEAKLSFFICTDKLCARQQKTLSVPVEVN